MAYVPVQSKLTGISFTGVYTTPVLTGSLLIVAGSCDVTTTISASQTGGLATVGAFTSLAQQNMKSNTERGAVLIALVSNGGTCTITMAASGASFFDVAIHEFSLAVGGPVPASPGDQVHSANWVATPASPGTTGTTAQANELIFSYCCDARTQAIAADTGGGYTQLLNGNPNFTTMTQYKTVSATGTFTTSPVVTGTPTDGASIIVTIKEAAAAAGLLYTQLERDIRGLNRGLNGGLA